MEPTTNPSKLPGTTLTYMLTTRAVGVLVLAVAGFFIKTEENQIDPMIISGGILAIGILVIIQTILYYNLFSYSIASNNITINSGIIFRESKTIDFNKIQNVNNVRGPLQMLFGLTEVQIWTASPSQVTYTTVSSGQNGQRNTVPKPKPEATLIILKDVAEVLRNNLIQQKI